MLSAEEEIFFYIYAVYVVYYPRVAGKDRNTAAYADYSLTALKDQVNDRYSRYPGGQASQSLFITKGDSRTSQEEPIWKVPYADAYSAASITSYSFTT